MLDFATIVIGGCFTACAGAILLIAGYALALHNVAGI